MDRDLKRLTDFLVNMGVEQVPHTHKSYLAHLIAVYRSLEAQGYPEDVCRAGMFHSIYGTERFQGLSYPWKNGLSSATSSASARNAWRI